MALLTLDEWASEHFRTPPSSGTLRKWAREGRISPAPVKHGRSYYVEPGAHYIEPSKHQATPTGLSLRERVERDRRERDQQYS